MDKLLIGFAEESLVSDKRIRLYGQFYERISEYVESEITATAMAVSSGGEEMILVSADLTGAPTFLMDIIRKKFAAMTDEISPEKLIVTATHTHTSHTIKMANSELLLTTKSILSEFMAEDKEYKELVTADENVLDPVEATELVSDKIALAAYRAWKARRPSYIVNDFGRAVVGMCRRVTYSDGSAEMWGDTNRADFEALEGGNDSGIELLYVFDCDKKLSGIVANIACPSQILEHRSFVSADYWGRAKANIRDRLGENIFLVGLGGAGGDQCPRDLVRWVHPKSELNDPNISRPHLIERKADPSMFDIEGCNRAGKRISNEIISVYEELNMDRLTDEAPFVHKVRKLDLPLRKATHAEYEHAVREIEYYVKKNEDKPTFDYSDNAKMYVNAGTIKRYREQQFNEVYPIEYHSVRLGNIAIVTNPFELFLDFGNRIKARSYAEQTFVVQLACGAGGYLPTAKAEMAGHYSAYITSGNVGHEGGDLLVREQLKDIQEMFGEGK